MKKLLLILTVLACGIGQVRAASNAYLYGSFNSWNSSDMSYPFTKLSDSDFRIAIPSSWVNSTTVYFRFKVDSNEWGVSSSDQEVTGSEYGAECDKTAKAFYISSVADANSKVIIIKIQYKDTGYGDKWHVSYYTRPATTYNVKFEKPGEWTGNPNTAYAYAFDSDGVRLLGNWPGTSMTHDSGSMYSCSIKAPVNEMGKVNNVIFNENSGSNQTADLTLFSGEYNKSGITKQTVSLPSNDYGTFSSSNILTFPEGDVNIVAYKASVSEGKILMTRVTGAVPANTGLMIKRKSAGDNSMDAAVAAAASVDMTGNLMQPSTGAEVVSDGEKDRYVLAKNKSTGDIHFAKLASSREVPVGMAYLEVAHNTFPASAPSLSIFFDGEDDMTTGIDAIEHGTLNIDHYYDLQGRRVSKPTKGLYIVNGKKVVIK